MNIRPMRLPPGWYPESAEGVSRAIEVLLHKDRSEQSSIAGVSPHAGWYFCASLAVKAFENLKKDASAVIIFGGHLPAGARPLAGMEDAFATPLGELKADAEFLAALQSELGLGSDRGRDNTVEVLLPFVKYFFPKASLLWLRAPNDSSSLELGALVAQIGRKLGRNAVAIGSTDLTHYGEAYGFAPRGSGREALAWVKEENDKRIVDAMLAMDARETVRLGEETSAACSAGAACAAIGFAAAMGARSVKLNAYSTSADVRPDEQFVGYCSISYG
jgi:AmmeMemoRadiSam system protein B